MFECWLFKAGLEGGYVKMSKEHKLFKLCLGLSLLPLTECDWDGSDGNMITCVFIVLPPTWAAFLHWIFKDAFSTVGFIH